MIDDQRLSVSSSLVLRRHQSHSGQHTYEHTLTPQLFDCLIDNPPHPAGPMKASDWSQLSNQSQRLRPNNELMFSPALRQHSSVKGIRFLYCVPSSWFPDVHRDLGKQVKAVDCHHAVRQRVDPVLVHGVSGVSDAVEPVDRRRRIHVSSCFHTSTGGQRSSYL